MARHLRQLFLLLLLSNSLEAFNCGNVQPNTRWKNVASRSWRTLIDDEPAPSNTTEKPLERIIGGDLAGEGAWPWQAALYMGNSKGQNYFCGGTLLTKRHILTAAHCTDGMVASRSQVVLGTNTPETTGTVFNVETLITHPQYNPTTLVNDIAIIRLTDTAIISTVIQPICLYGGNASFSFSQAYVTGWGTYTIGNSNDLGDHSQNLLQAQVSIIDQNTCASRWLSFNTPARITSSMICAGDYRKGTGEVIFPTPIQGLQGDSGGPLQVQAPTGEWFQVGLTSFGLNDPASALIDQATYPGVYTRVEAFCNFINLNTDNETFCGLSSTPSLTFLFLISILFSFV